jgi:S1-C subfamily serine protease
MLLFKSLALSLSMWLSVFAQPPIPMSTAVLVVSDLGMCSGTVIANHSGATTILTADHCVHGQILDYVQIGGLGRKYKHFTAVTESKQYDLALIFIDKTGSQPVAQLSQNTLIRAGTFSLVGLSSTVPWALSKGFVMGDPEFIHYTGYKGWDMTLACMGCDEGDSGSGLFNDRGELVGVLVAGSKDNVRQYAITLHDVRKFLWAAAKIK